ncbi:hypothetical protein N865_03255 [Intrasporangium oryzae NRRL B-24470]|uniref:DUF2202 domain-containing protein n=1 Tax=Intrasporangium oryzae NRRL B-24470 TaxID=1386089 RepID=W9GDA8_9MICO|nr:DUF2202 domain-containing protein [Intrasporangium oryzae]EWT02818.1 hypothetical protein N865_03255 [Intrasporangium oryzae NRRL B-24470]
MFTTWKTRVIAVAGAALVTAAGAQGIAQAVADPPAGTGTAVMAPTAASSNLTKGLQLTREEERMARDLYQALADQYDGALPFSMVTRSEQRHFDAVGTLLTRYGITDPSSGRPAGTYADPAIQKLYADWLAQGRTSLAAAYDVGVALEKRDIADLETLIASTTEADAKQLYTTLERASEHHLAAFQAYADGRAPSTGYGHMGNGYGNGMMGNGLGNGSGSGYGNGMMGNGVGGMDPADCPLLDGSD